MIILLHNIFLRLISLYLFTNIFANILCFSLQTINLIHRPYFKKRFYILFDVIPILWIFAQSQLVFFLKLPWSLKLFRIAIQFSKYCFIISLISIKMNLTDWKVFIVKLGECWYQLSQQNRNHIRYFFAHPKHK